MKAMLSASTRRRLALAGTAFNFIAAVLGHGSATFWVNFAAAVFCGWCYVWLGDQGPGRP